MLFEIWASIPAEWKAALTSSTGVAVLGAIAGVWYKARIESSIRHDYDAKLEAVRSDRRKEEEAFRSELQSRGKEIEALRGGALSALASRYAALDTRRILAAERLWVAVARYSELKGAVALASRLKFEEVLETTAKDDSEGKRLRAVAENIWKISGLEQIEKKGRIVDPDQDRPFLPTYVWALYQAYSRMLVFPVTLLAAARHGLDKKFLQGADPMLNLVKAALPNQRDFIERNGIAVLPALVDELEIKLLDELQKCLRNPASDLESVEQAGAIMEAAMKLEPSRSGGRMEPTQA